MDEKRPYSKKETSDIWLIPSEQGYKDRKMAKWQGFILSDHAELVQKRKKKQKKTPYSKSKQSLEVVSSILKEAYMFHKKIDVQVDVLENGYYTDKCVGYVLGVDQTLVYIQTETTLLPIPLESIRCVTFSSSNEKWFKKET